MATTMTMSTTILVIFMIFVERCLELDPVSVMDSVNPCNAPFFHDDHGLHGGYDARDRHDPHSRPHHRHSSNYHFNNSGHCRYGSYTPNDGQHTLINTPHQHHPNASTHLGQHGCHPIAKSCTYLSLWQSRVRCCITHLIITAFVMMIVMFTLMLRIS
uniref:Uncharacterized protein n=1 Tax=Spongospora subterranea TaxID=70186 RepID=A0A0H5R6L0_9EUKA|eukprot:CRZ09765.1 hypothetical protein [Spongospora subterranea]